MLIRVDNHGPLIRSTNYWGSSLDREGFVFVSTNAGCVRVLLPETYSSAVGEMRTGKYVIISRGPDPKTDQDIALSLVWEDDSQGPFGIDVGRSSIDMLPAAPRPGREWVVATWVLKNGRPHKALERPGRWRRSKQLPDRSPWSDIN